jgi:hypothetical protein
MLTPNEVRKKKQAVEDEVSAIIANTHPLGFPRTSRPVLLNEFYEEVLREISQGSIDPKSLAIAALGIEV